MTFRLPQLCSILRKLSLLIPIIGLTPAFMTLVRAQTLEQPVQSGDIVGTWQGILQLPGSNGQPGKELRIVLKVARSPNGSLSALNYSIDQSGEPMATADVTLQGRAFHYSVPSLGGSYDGQLDTTSNTIGGKWANNLTLDFARATITTAWDIPAPPATRKSMTEQDPSFQVATIKLSDPAKPGRYFRVFGRTYETHDTSLADLIQVAYGVNTKQIVNAPSWVRDNKFDLQAIPDADGDPDGKQWLIMLRKLLADRFALTLHHEQQLLSSYVLTVAKTGSQNLTPSQSKRPLPSLEFNRTSNGLVLPARNATMGQFCQMLQQAVLDRPVVDHTGLTGNFDFTLIFTPDDSQFGGHPPASSPQSDAPNLFEALQQQLGLKLTVEKVPTDVLFIDHAHEPSPN